jgi:hypothetical protein
MSMRLQRLLKLRLYKVAFILALLVVILSSRDGLLASFKPRRTFYDRYFADVHARLDVDVNYDAIFARYVNNFDQLSRVWSAEFFRIHPNRTVPPANYAQWLFFAQRRQCPIHPVYYMQISKVFSSASFKRLVSL